MADNKILIELLQNIVAEEQIQEPDIQVKPVTTSGANFTSNLYRIVITDKINKTFLKLFAKIAAIQEDLRNSFSDFQPYEIERIAYTTLFKVYVKLEKKHGIREDHKLVLPKYYGADSTPLQETIVLEDLSCKGYELPSRFESVNWEYATLAITELTKLHALSFVYEHEKPVEFQNILSRFPKLKWPDNEETKGTCKSYAQLAVDGVREENKEKLRQFLDGLSMKTFTDLNVVIEHRVLIHGDFRSSNILYRKKLNGEIQVIPVDFQTIQTGCPASDFVYFLISCTDGSFRAQYYQPLVDHYYSELRAALARFGLEVDHIYPRDNFEFEVKQKLLHGLKIFVIGLPLIATPENQALKPGDSIFGTENIGNHSGDLYKKKLNEMVDDYVAWGLI